MTNYVIDPRVFYWINVFGTLQFVCTAFGIIFVAAFFSLVVAWIYNSCEVNRGYEHNLIYLKVCKRWAIITGMISFIIVTAAIFIPDKTTSVEMLIAKTATFDNVNWTVQQVKDAVDYIVQAIKGI